MENVTFTCTALGTEVEWSLPNGINVILTGVAENINKEFVEFDVYILAVTGFNATAITSTLTTVAENGVTLSCTGQNPVETVGSSTIQLAGKEIGNIFIEIKSNYKSSYFSLIWPLV